MFAARCRPRASAGRKRRAAPGGNFLRTFLEHCAHGTNYVSGKIGSPLDFISFHAKGSTAFVNDHVRMGMSSALRNMNDAFAVVASFPEYKSTPLVIGECDPEGCAACTGPQETYRNGTMYSSYTAATFPRAMDIAEQHGVNLQGALTWAFEFEDQPPFAGFRALASAGLDLPVLNLFRMFAKMSGQRLAVESSAGLTADTIRARNVRENNPDVSALASLDKNKLAVLVWHYYDDDVPGPDANVDLALDNLPFANGDVKLTQYRIDADHSNSYEAWKRMGSPLPLSETQFAELEKAGQLAELEPPKNLRVNDGKLDLNFAAAPAGGCVAGADLELSRSIGTLKPAGSARHPDKIIGKAPFSWHHCSGHENHGNPDGGTRGVPQFV